MEPIEYLRIIRRRWPVIAVLLLVGLAVGFVTAHPASSAPTATPGLLGTEFQATAILGIPASASDPSGLSLDSIAYLATSGPVPDMTATVLGGGARGSEIAAQVQVQAKDFLAVIQVTASAASPTGAATLANAYGGQIVAFINDQLATTHQNQLAADKAQLAALTTVIDQLQAQPSSAVSQSEVTQAVNQYAQDNVTYQQQLIIGPLHTGLHVIDPAAASTAIPHTAGGKVTRAIVGTSRKSRLALGGLAGLIVGIGVALIWERLDIRIRTREQAEKTFGLPVLAEIPPARRGGRSPDLVVLDDPLSAGAESYRMLQTVLALAPAQDGGGRGGAILLSSPGPFEGKDVVAANLAASFSEAGSSVALVSVDSSDCSLPALLGGSAQGPQGQDASGREPAMTPWTTSIEGVSLLTNGLRPGVGQARHHADMVATGRGRADIVIVDTPPVLATPDASRMSASVDSVVLLCEVGTVRPREATLAVEGLRRVGAPLQGVVLVAPAVRSIRFLRVSRPTPSAPALGQRAPFSRRGGEVTHALGRRGRRQTPVAARQPAAGDEP
jgi:Mrp family chromosome partitioning ATPase